MTNARIADTFLQVAELLEQQGASPHRIRAWRAGAAGIRDEPRALTDVFRDHGRIGLEAVTAIGPRLAAVIIELIKSGRCSALDRLRGDAVHLFEGVPGLGHALAERVHRQLGIETLEDLEAAAHDGRLATVEGFGPRRIAGIRDVLATRLRREPTRPAGTWRPPVELLLEIDRAYREAVAAGTLPVIAPRRFNPRHEAWLPILHVDRAGWAFTALYSNTELAHRLGRTHDWVVIYFHAPGGAEDASTIVTEWRGGLRGLRVVRGREAECERLHASHAA